MPQRPILRVVSILFAFNGLVSILFAFAVYAILDLPKAAEDAIAPLLAVSVLPLVILGFVARALQDFLHLGMYSSMGAASLCSAAFSTAISVGIWRMRPGAMVLAGISFGGSGALFAMSLVYRFIDRSDARAFLGHEPLNLNLAALEAIGAVVCIGLGVYLLRAARAERGEYPAPEIGLSLRGK